MEVLGALEPVLTLGIPSGKADGGADVSFDQNKGLTIKQTETTGTESHSRSEDGSSSHTGSGGNESDSEYKESHQEDKKDETKNTREVNIGGDGGLNYSKTKERSGESQNIDEESSKTHEETEEADEDYYHRKESTKEEENKHVKKNSYKEKETSGFQVGKEGFQKKKTEKSEESISSETNENRSSKKESEEERIQNGDEQSYKKSSSESDASSSDSSSSEVHKQSSTGSDDSKGTGGDSPKGSATHFTIFEEHFQSTDNNGVKVSEASGFVQEDSRNYSHVGGEGWENTGDKKVDQFFTALDNLSGSNAADISKRRRKRHTASSQNQIHLEETHHANHGSEQGLLRNNNGQHIYSNEHNGPENVNLRNHQSINVQNENAGSRNIQHHAGEANRFSENENHGSIHTTYRSEGGNQHSGRSSNQGGGINVHQSGEGNRFAGNEHYGSNQGIIRSGGGNQYSAGSNNQERGSNVYHSGEANRVSENEQYRSNQGSYRSEGGIQHSATLNNQGHNTNLHQNGAASHFSENEHYGSNHGSYRSDIGNQYYSGASNQAHGSNVQHGVNNENYRSEVGKQYSINSGNQERRSTNENYRASNSNHLSLNSGNENYRSGNDISEAAHNSQRAGNSNRYSANTNYESINGDYRSRNTNQNYVNYKNGNSNGNFGGQRTGNRYFTSSEQGNQGSSQNRRRNYYSKGYRNGGLGQKLRNSGSFENAGSIRRNYKLGSRNYESVAVRNTNTGSKNSVRNGNWGNVRRNYGNGQYGYRNGYKQNNVYSQASAHSNVAGNQNVNQQDKTAINYRQGVKHEDVLRFLTNNARQVSHKNKGFNTGNYIRNFDSYNTGYRPFNNYGYPRRGVYNKYVSTQGKSGAFAGLGAMDLHHVEDNTHYSTGNGRYRFIPGKNGGKHRYYDTATGYYLNTRKITLHGGENVIVPGKYAIHPGYGGSSGVNQDILGLYLGSGIFYLGGGSYRHQGQIIPATKIAEYLKSVGITSILLTSNGLPLGLSVGYFPFNLGNGLTYIGDGNYKYKDKVISSTEIIAFCKSKHFDNIALTNDGFPEDLFNGNLDSIFKNHITLPIHLEKDLYFIGNGHYKWKDEIIPSINIAEIIKKHDLTIKITEEGLPSLLFDGTIETNNGATTDNNPDTNEDEHLNPHGIFPYDVGCDVFYDGKGNYIYQNITIPKSTIIEFCKSHDLTNVSIRDDGFPTGLFNDTEHDELGSNWKNPVYLGEDLYYLGSGHYKYKGQIIIASDIGAFIKKLKLKVHITKEGLPLALYIGGADDQFGPDENEELSPYENSPFNYHDMYPLNLGSNLSYLGDGSYSYNDEIISSKDIVKFCQSHSINNISFTDDGFLDSLFRDTEDDGGYKFPLDLGDDLFYYKCGHYKHHNKTIPAVDIVEYIKNNNLNLSVTDYGLPSKLVEEHNGQIDNESSQSENEETDQHKNGPSNIYGDFPYDLGSNISYLGDGRYKCNKEIIDCSDIKKYCESHNINDVELTEDGFPANLFNETISDQGSNKEFPIDIGKGLYFLGYGHYKYQNKIYPAINITDIIKKLNLNISFTKDNIPEELLGENGFSGSENTPIDLGDDLFYLGHGSYNYHNETITADKIVEFCKGLNINVTFTKNGYPEDYNDEETSTSHESSECPKGPIDLGDDIYYIGDCNYRYQDHVIPAKYILGLLDILHVHDINLPVGPNDDYISSGDSNGAGSKDDFPLDLGFDVYDLGNGTHKYKNNYIPADCYTDFLKILGLKTESENSEKLVKDGEKSERSEDDISSLIDGLLRDKNKDTSKTTDDSTDDNKTTDSQATSASKENASDGSDSKNNSSNDNDGHDKRQSHNPGGPRKPVKDDDNDNSKNSKTSTSDSTASATSTNSDDSSCADSNSSTQNSSGDSSNNSSSDSNTTSDNASGNKSNTDKSESSESDSSKSSKSSKESKTITISSSINLSTTKKTDSSATSSNSSSSSDDSTSSSNETDGSSSSANSNSSASNASGGSSSSSSNNSSSSSKKNQDSSETNSSGGSSSSGDGNNSNDSAIETIKKTVEHNASKTASSSEKSKEEKETDSDGNTKIKKTSSSSAKETKKESKKEDYTKTDGDGNKESYHSKESSYSSQKNSTKTSSEQTTSN